jgi:cytoskeletal protein CcmA (bactofilin family)
MAWGWPHRKERKSVEWTGFLERGVKVDGRLETTGTFRIDSEMKGHLFSEDTLIVGEHAVIEGQITGNEVIVGGRCNGTIRAKASVELQGNAIVTGEVHTACLVIEPGAVFDGQCFLSASPDASNTISIPVRSAAAIVSGRT